ncbi:hypothetical protein RCL1_001037 [Eukaryota sp. TZLM3-RCL]
MVLTDALQVSGALLLLLALGFFFGFFAILKLKSLLAYNFFVNSIALPSLVFAVLAPFSLTSRAVPVMLTVLGATISTLLILTMARFLFRLSTATFATSIVSTLFGSNAVVGRPLLQALYPDEPEFFNEFILYTLAPVLLLAIPIGIFLFELQRLKHPIRAKEPPIAPPILLHREIQTISRPASPAAASSSRRPSRRGSREHLIVEVDEIIAASADEAAHLSSPGETLPLAQPAEDVPQDEQEEPQMTKADAFRRSLLRTVTSPILLATVLAFIWALLELPLPLVLFFFFSSLGAVATPLGLFTVGLSLGLFDWTAQKLRYRRIITYVFLRMVMFPLLHLPFAVLFQLSGPETRVVLFFSATPSSTGAYTLARHYASDAEDTSLDVAPALAIQTVIVFPLIYAYVVILDAFNWFN